MDSSTVHHCFIECTFKCEKHLDPLYKSWFNYTISKWCKLKYPVRLDYFVTRPTHYSLTVRNYLYNKFINRCIVRRGFIELSAKFPKITSLYFDLWSYLEANFNFSKPENIREFKNRFIIEFFICSLGIARKLYPKSVRNCGSSHIKGNFGDSHIQVENNVNYSLSLKFDFYIVSKSVLNNLSLYLTDLRDFEINKMRPF